MNIKIWNLNKASLCLSQHRRELSSQYLKARERIWAEQSEYYGSRLWNGDVYTIVHVEGHEDVALHLGQCEYKDIIIKEKYGADRIANEYGEANVLQHLIVCVIPITSDGFFVFPIVGDGTAQEPGLIDLFGGTANKDEVEVTSLQDISKIALHEIQEEVGWSASCGELKPWLIVNYNCKYAMLYQFRLNSSSANLKTTLAKSEVSSLLLAKQEEISAILNRRCSIEFEVFSKMIDECKHDL